MDKKKDMLAQYIEMLGDKDVEIVEVMLENATATFHRNGKHFKAPTGEKTLSIKMLNKKELAEFYLMKSKLEGWD
jgi:hypothetical protein